MKLLCLSVCVRACVCVCVRVNACLRVVRAPVCVVPSMRGVKLGVPGSQACIMVACDHL